MSAAQRKLDAVRALSRTLPDARLRDLDDALAGASGDLVNVADVISTELLKRRAANLALAPLLILREPPRHVLATVRWDQGNLAGAFWRDVEAATPSLASEAEAELLRLRNEDPVPRLFDELCEQAADRVERGEGELAHYSALGASVCDLLRLTPVARRAAAQMSGWLGRPSGEEAAQARLAFKDAADTCDGGGPLLLRILCANLDDARHALRLISVMAERPSDRFLAASELRDFGEALLQDLEEKIDAVRRFDPAGGAEAGGNAAATVADVAAGVAEFELHLSLTRDGPWGARVADAKRVLAATVESRLREVEPALNAAFPLQAARVAKRFLRSVPNLKREPNLAAVQRAEGLLVFLADTRPAAATAGFGAARAKLFEQVEERLSHYVEDLLELAHGGDDQEAAARARSFLSAVGLAVGVLQGAQSADTLRRRAAAA